MNGNLIERKGRRSAAAWGLAVFAVTLAVQMPAVAEAEGPWVYSTCKLCEASCSETCKQLKNACICTIKRLEPALQTIAFGPAFVPCDTPNAVTQDDVPACSIPMTFNEAAGNPPNGWIWGGKTKIKLKIKALPNKLVSPLNPSDSVGTLDVSLNLKGKGIEDNSGVPATGTGTLVLTVRESRTSPLNAYLTLVDRPLSFAFTVSKGQVKFKTSVNALLNSLGEHGLPPFEMEILSVQIFDPNGVLFSVQALGRLR